MPPAAAARVAVAKPSHSVRPGSLTCTWVSTRPGSRTSSSARVETSPGSRMSRPDHEPAARPVAGRPHARSADRRAGAAPDDAARGRQPRRHRRLPGTPRRRPVDATDAGPAGDRRRVRRAARRAARVHRPVRRPGARGTLAGHPPAAFLAATRRRPPTGPGEPPAVPPVPANVLVDRVQARARHSGRLPAAVAAGAGLPEGRHGDVRAVPCRVGFRRARTRLRSGRRARDGARVRGRRAAARGGRRARSSCRPPARTSCRCWSSS